MAIFLFKSLIVSSSSRCFSFSSKFSFRRKEASLRRTVNSSSTDISSRASLERSVNINNNCIFYSIILSSSVNFIVFDFIFHWTSPISYLNISVCARKGFTCGNNLNFKEAPRSCQILMQICQKIKRTKSGRSFCSFQVNSDKRNYQKLRSNRKKVNHVSFVDEALSCYLSDSDSSWEK